MITSKSRIYQLSYNLPHRDTPSFKGFSVTVSGVIIPTEVKEVMNKEEVDLLVQESTFLKKQEIAEKTNG